jgi:hypothetical protein
MDWLETFVGSPPGVPIAEATRVPGQAVPEQGYLVPSDAAGFGLEIPEEWLEPFFARAAPDAGATDAAQPFSWYRREP